MKYIAEIEYVKENGSITSVSANGLTSVSGGTFGYTSNSPSSSDGKLSNVTLTISKSNNKAFRILFKDNYATKYSINGEEFSNNKRELIVFNTSNSLTIKLLKLSKFSANYEILKIDTNIKLEYDNNSILDCTRGSQNKNDSTSPSYSPISQYGNLEIKDIDDVIINLSINNMLKENKTKVNLYIEDNNIKNQIASYDLASKVSYKYGEYKCNFELTDEISKYNEILIEPITLQFKTFDNLYNILKSYTPNSDEFEISSEAFERFNYIESFFYTKENQTLFDLWSWFCNATKTTLYINELGKKVFKVWL